MSETDIILIQDQSPMVLARNTLVSRGLEISAKLLTEITRQSLYDAALQGDAEAQYILASKFYTADGDWLHLSHNPYIISKFSDKYDYGDAVQQDSEEALKWCRMAAELGHVEAQVMLGWMYDYGDPVHDPAEAARWWRLAAEQGHAEAQCSLGFICLCDSAPQASAEAAVWYQMAAEQGCCEAQFELGRLYLEGEGVPQDYDEARKWYRLAAEQGDRSAQEALGGMCLRCKDVPDHAEAMRWFRMAADRGSSDAQRIVGWLYLWGYGLLPGTGVPRDYVQAYLWLKLAATNGNQQAVGLLREWVPDLITPAHIAEAERLIRDGEFTTGHTRNNL
jgi:TPR repeat protein